MTNGLNNHESTRSDGTDHLVKSMARFAMTGGIATGVDITLYLVFVSAFLGPVAANIASFGIAMCLNFFLQRRFVFDLNRPLLDAFKLSMAVSFGGMALSTSIVYALNAVSPLNDSQWLIKLIATGLVFFYNYFMKRYAFEKRFL